MTNNLCSKCGSNRTEKHLFTSSYYECPRCDSKQPPAAVTGNFEKLQLAIRHALDKEYKDIQNSIVSLSAIDQGGLDETVFTSGIGASFEMHARIARNHVPKTNPFPGERPSLEIGQVSQDGKVWEPMYDDTGACIGMLFIRYDN